MRKPPSDLNGICWFAGQRTKPPTEFKLMLRFEVAMITTAESLVLGPKARARIAWWKRIRWGKPSPEYRIGRCRPAASVLGSQMRQQCLAWQSLVGQTSAQDARFIFCLYATPSALRTVFGLTTLPDRCNHAAAAAHSFSPGE